MRRILLACLFLVSLAHPSLAWAQGEQPFTLTDPLAIHIVSAGTLEARMLGPYEAQVSVFSVPEPDGTGERLYVGLVEDLIDRRSPRHLWKGPVAANWSKLAAVPGYKPDVTAPNPARYRIQRHTVIPGGRMQMDLMEIDLSVRPAQLRRVEPTPGNARYLEAFPLDELPMNESLGLITRLETQRIFRLQDMTLRSYEMIQGDIDPPKKRPVTLKPWEVLPESHLLALSFRGSKPNESVYFLPMRPFGWKVRQQLSEAAAGKRKGRFALEMFADYLVPGERGELVERSARYLVSVGMDGMSITTLDEGYRYDVATESWTKEKPMPRVK